MSWLDTSERSAPARPVVPTPAIRKRSLGDRDCWAGVGLAYAPRPSAPAAAAPAERKRRRVMRDMAYSQGFVRFLSFAPTYPSAPPNSTQPPAALRGEFTNLSAGFDLRSG